MVALLIYLFSSYSCLVDILLGFGCTVLCYDMYQSEYVKSKKNARYVELDELLTQSDIISLHVPLTPSSRYMINDESIAKMKKVHLSSFAMQCTKIFFNHNV